MFEIGFLVKVEHLSNHGKNRINEHGAVWEVEKISPSSILLKSTDGEDYRRWFDFNMDRDFAIVDVLTIPEGD